MWGAFMEKDKWFCNPAWLNVAIVVLALVGSSVGSYMVQDWKIGDAYKKIGSIEHRASITEEAIRKNQIDIAVMRENLRFINDKMISVERIAEDIRRDQLRYYSSRGFLPKGDK